MTVEPILYLSAALHGALMVMGGMRPFGFRWRSSVPSVFSRSPAGSFHSVLDLVREILDVFASAYGIRRIGCARFVSENLLGAKRNASAIRQQRKALRRRSEFFQRGRSVRRAVV
jgi:hypothetical protein